MDKNVGGGNIQGLPIDVMVMAVIYHVPVYPTVPFWGESSTMKYVHSRAFDKIPDVKCNWQVQTP